MHCQHTPARAAVRECRCKLQSSCNTKYSYIVHAGATGRTCNRVRHGELVMSVQGYVRVAYVRRRMHHACGLLSCGSAPILLRFCYILHSLLYHARSYQAKFMEYMYKRQSGITMPKIRYQSPRIHNYSVTGDEISSGRVHSQVQPVVHDCTVFQSQRQQQRRL